MPSVVFNQNFVPGWNSIYQNLVNKINSSIISSNQFTSPFSRLLQTLETGNYLEDIHINPGQALLQDTVTNSNMFTDYADDIAVAIYETDVDLCYPSTYKEYVVRQGFNVLENVGALISALISNIRTTLEYHRSALVKQMLYNAWVYGMVDCINIPDPALSAENSGNMAVALNTLIDDFRTEINSRYIIYNNQLGLSEGQKRLKISAEAPYVIIFNDLIRSVEFNNAINLAWLKEFNSGNSNMDWESRLIRLNSQDFPTSTPATDRSAVTGNNVSAVGINFYEPPTDDQGNESFSMSPKAGNKILAMVFEPSAMKLYTQLSISTQWANPATLATTNREIFRGIMQLGAFAKIAFITCTSGV